MLTKSNGLSKNECWQEVLPWIGLIKDDLVLNKDGSIMAAFELTGLDLENLGGDEDIDSCTNQLQQSFSLLDSRFTAWITVTKQKDNEYLPNVKNPITQEFENYFTNPVSKELDNLVARHFNAGKVFNIKHRLYLLFTGSVGISKFMDTVQRLMNEEGDSLFKAAFKAINPANTQINAALYDSKQLENNIREFEEIVVKFVDTHSEIQLRRLSQFELESELVKEANINSKPSEKFYKPPGAMLDSWASLSEVTFGNDMVKVSGVNGDKFVSQIGLKEYPAEQLSSTIFERLLLMPFEFKLCHCIRFLNNQEANSQIKLAVEYFNTTQYSLVARVMHKVAGGVLVARQDKQKLYQSCLNAQERQLTQGLGFMLHSMTVSVYGDSVKECATNTSTTNKVLSDAKVTVYREKLNLAASFISMIPGQWSFNLRLNLQNSEVVADCMPIYTFTSGSKWNSYLSSEVYKKSVPNFAVFSNIYSTKSYFSPYVGQVGHTLIIAPTGGGKTTFVNFIISQFQRYENVNTYIFDRDASCKIVTLMHGGKHIDLQTGGMKLNPLSILSEKKDDSIIWCREYIVRRIFEAGYIATHQDRNQIDIALGRLQGTIGLTNQQISITDLAIQLPNHLREVLREWLRGNPYGMFDSNEDDFSLSNWTCIEMKQIMSNERIARAFLDYAFRRIESSLDGRPTFIYLEEASFLLNHPLFSKIIEDWLKTLRKANAFLWMTVQSPDSVMNSEVSASLKDNIKSFLLMRNKKIETHRESYIKNLGLTPHQVSMIGTLKNVGEYMLVQDGVCRKLKTLFDSDSLAYIRSELNVQNIFNRHYDKSNPDWRFNYLQAVKLEKYHEEDEE